MSYVQSISIDSSSYISRFWQGVKTTCEIIGYSRAASHLATLGYHKEAKNCMMQVAKLKE